MSAFELVEDVHGLGTGPMENLLRVQISLLRENWRNDGAEGDTVHAVCDAVEALLLRQRETCQTVLDLEGQRLELRRACEAALDHLLSGVGHVTDELLTQLKSALNRSDLKVAVEIRK